MTHRIVLLIMMIGVMLTSVSIIAGEKSVKKPKPVTAVESEKQVVTVAASSTSKSTTRTGEQIDWKVISSGGTEGASENFQMMGTAGQTATGFAGSTNFKVSHGYWYSSVFGPSYVCGDADGNGIINISDAVYLISYIFGGGPAPEPVVSGDADCNQIVNISDAVYLIAYIFGGGPAPCETCP
jgi:hypothetical protein